MTNYCSLHDLSQDKVLTLLSEGASRRDLLRTGCGPCSQMVWDLMLTDSVAVKKSPERLQDEEIDEWEEPIRKRKGKKK